MNFVIIYPDHDVASDRCQTIIWSNAGLQLFDYKFKWNRNANMGHLQGPIMGEWVRSVGAKFRYLNIYFQFPICKSTIPWASYQIRKLWFAHAPGIPGTFFPPPTSKETVSKRSRHASRHVLHARAVMHVRIANPREKRSRHFRCMHNPQLSVSGMRPMPEANQNLFWSGLGRSHPEKNNYWTPL